MYLIERERELAALRDRLAGARTGRGRVVVVSGPVASGKSALLRAFAREVPGAGAALLDVTRANQPSSDQPSSDQPAGLVRRLAGAAAALPGVDEDVLRLLDGDGGGAFRAGAPAAGGDAHLAAPALQELCGMLLAAAARTPLVIVVDDVQRADAASARFLLYLAHRIGPARILLLLGERPGLGAAWPPPHAELLGRAHCHRLALAPLSPDAQARVLAPELDAAGRRAVAAASQQLTAGNPLLLRGLVADNPAPAGVDPRLVTGPAFAQAVAGCLRRCEPEAAPVARALAVAGDAASPGLLGRLLGLETQHVVQLLDVLATTGLLVEGRVRHPAVRAALADGVDPAERAALHGRIARLLHERGAAAPAVADHLLAAHAGSSGASAGDGARPAAESWVVSVLQEAAGAAVAGADQERATSCLRLALAGCADARQQARVTGALAGLLRRAEPRVETAAGHPAGDPAAPAAAPSTGAATSAAGPDAGVPHPPAGASVPRQQRRDTGGDPLEALGRLLWFGGTAAPSAAAPRRRGGRFTARLPDAATDREALTLQLSCLYPRLFPDAHPGGQPGPLPAVSPGRVAVGHGDRVPKAAGRPLRAAVALAAVLAGERGANVGAAPRSWTGTDGVLDAAEQVLQAARIGETPLGGVLAALAALIYDDRLAEAARWCDPLLNSAASGRSPLWHALLLAARAQISLRQGDLLAAEQQATDALTRISPAGWGVGIGLPLSVLVLANTAMGRYGTAETHLAAPVPRAMFHTLSGLHYLQARGRHRLATGRPRAALEDLDACRELLAGWRFDAPGLVAWHTDTAQARLALGERDAAVAVLDELLPTLRPGPSRTRGVALRVRAGCLDGAEREPLLRQAVDQLEQCGDRYELVLALAELSRAQHDLGRHEQAFAAARRAQRLRRHGFATPDPTDGPPAGPACPAGSPEDLTDAELKVAALAAHGQTNREIATTLLITVSTVEQHLTRVYRKLGVRGRAALHPRLWTDPAALFGAGDAGPSTSAPGA